MRVAVNNRWKICAGACVVVLIFWPWVSSSAPASSDPHPECLALRNQYNGTLFQTKVRPPFSQFSQDLFLWRNFFQKRGGFYIDLGANHPTILSNTYFFDECLNWSGLCVEPNPSYHPSYSKRRCKLVPECVTNTNGIHNFTFAGSDGHLGGGQQVRCRTLEAILRAENIRAADFVSLDIEGHEIAILKDFPFAEFDVLVWMIEVNKVDIRVLDKIMDEGGYAKFAMLHIDALYVKRQHKLWMPYRVSKDGIVPGEYWK